MSFEIFMLYILTRLDSIHGLLVTFTVIFSGVAFFTVLGKVCMTSDGVSENKPELKLVNTIISYKWVYIGLLIALTLMPSKDDVLFIVSGTGIIELAKSDKTSEIAGHAFGIVNNYLESMEKQTQQENTNKK